MVERTDNPGLKQGIPTSRPEHAGSDFPCRDPTCRVIPPRSGHQRWGSCQGKACTVGGGCDGVRVATIAERLLQAIRVAGPLDDDALAMDLDVSARQTISTTARKLAAQGHLRRYKGVDGKIVNEATALFSPPPDVPAEPQTLPLGSPVITEDEVKRAVQAHLVSEGYVVAVAWGRTRGIDIDAKHPRGDRYVIEAKGQVAAAGAQQVNYFLGALGELFQRMDDPHATYALALPAHRQYRGLVDRLPEHGRKRLGLVVFWVSRGATTLSVEVDRG